MTTRRRTLAAIGAAAVAAPLACFAQQPQPKVARIGYLDATSASSDANWREALIAGLRALGYVEGKNLVVEYRWAEGKYDRLPGLADELAQKKSEVIVAAGTNAVQAARQTTTSVPIVMVRIPDPVASGFVASLARPGGNITGFSNINVDISGKRVELLRAALPKLSRISVLVNPQNPSHADFLKRTEAAARSTAVKVSSVQASTDNQIEAAFGAIKQERADALIVVPDTFFSSRAQRIAELAIQHRLPTMSGIREPVEAGGLMSYGQNNAEHYYRAATYVDKILKGAKPGELPVEQSTKLELVVNLKTAKAIGLTIPQQLLLQADKVIE